MFGKSNKNKTKKSADRRSTAKRRSSSSKAKPKGKRLSASVTQEYDWEADKSASRVSKLFAVVLIVHVVAILFLALRAVMKNEEPPPSAMSMVKEEETSQGLANSGSRNAARGVERVSSADAYLPTYLVVSGDSLRSISNKLKVSEKALLQANHMNGGASLYPGQRLFIPAKSPSIPAGHADGFAGGKPVLASSDRNLPATPAVPPLAEGRPVGGSSAIELKPETSEAPAAVPYRPVAAMPPARPAPPAPATPRESTPPIQPAPAPAAPVPPAPTPIPSAGIDAASGTYMVKQGDTFYGLSRKFGTTPEELMRINGFSDAKSLRVDAVIKVPRP